MKFGFSAFFLLSCGSGIEEKNQETAEALALQNAEPSCSVKILRSSPFPEATDMYYRDHIEVELSDADPDARIRLLKVRLFARMADQLLQQRNQIGL